MARKKQASQPLYALKDPFVASLNNFVDKAMLFHQAVKTALENGCIPNQAIAKMIKEHADALDAAMFIQGDEDAR
jgi:hypothetical protein